MKKIIKNILGGVVILGAVTSCSDDYIDPITPVAAGTDASAPVVTIKSPVSNIFLPAKLNSTDFTFSYSASDDIELGKVIATLDGNVISTDTSFLDYRNLSKDYVFKGLSLGNHLFKVEATDLTGKTTSKTFNFTVSKYNPLLASESLYVPFNSGNDFNDLVNLLSPSIVGAPSTATGKNGVAYKGGTDSYFSFPLSGLYSDKGISFTFWYKVNASPDRAGIITINDNTNDKDENRFQGLRLFREGNATSQRIKLNVGTNTGESWNDGGVINVDGSTWVHVGVTVSPTESKIYLNGVLQNTATYKQPFDFSTSTTLNIGSGAPSFTYWNHLSDLSVIDELRVYNTALTDAEVKATMQ